MTELLRLRYLLALSLLALLMAFAHGGLYTIVAAGGGDTAVNFYRVNRFTGSIVFCRHNECRNAIWRH